MYQNEFSVDTETIFFHGTYNYARLDEQFLFKNKNEQFLFENKISF